MTVTATNSTTPPANTPASGSSTDNSALGQLTGDFSTFLTLLTTQLKNQDPTSPMDSNQFTQQLVEFSQVEQQINSNDNLKTLIAQGQSQGSAMATTYLGKKVTVTNGEAPLSDGSATWDYTLQNNAGVSQITISDANNKVVWAGAGETATGDHTFTWDGKDTNGNQLADGTYTLAVTAKAADGSGVTSSVSSTGTVNEVDMSGTAPKLMIGPMSIDVSQVANVQN